MNTVYQTLTEMQESACQKNASAPLYGTKKGNDYHWMSYKEFGSAVDAFRSGLATLGVNKADKVAVISANSVKWAVAAYASYGRGAQYVPMYENQKPSEWKYIIKDSEAKVLLVANRTIYDAVQTWSKEIDSLEHVILLEETAPEEQNSYAHLIKTGEENPTPSASSDSDELVSLIYTSGTTGNPKGVCLTHHNMVFLINSVFSSLTFYPSDRSLSFLPWAHIFGQVAEVHVLIAAGMSTALVTDTTTLVDEMGTVKPTIFYAVPRVYNKIYERVHGQMQAKPQIIQELFEAGLKRSKKKRDQKSLNVLDQIIYTLADRLIFTKVKNRFGGRLRMAFSGASALSLEVAEFVNGLGIPLYEGYGLSESTGLISVNTPEHICFGSVGRAISNTRIEIDQSVEGVAEDEGEIIAYGDNIMQGYHKLPEVTKETLTADGGLRTGDVGRLDNDGYLHITGRLKEQYKLENGKYVAPAPIEEALQLSPYISQVMLYGENRLHTVAIIVVAMPALKEWVQKEGLDSDAATLLSHSGVREKFSQELDSACKSFKSYARPQNFLLFEEEWTVENHFLTPTLKLKRRVVEHTFIEQIEDLYANSTS